MSDILEPWSTKRHHWRLGIKIGDWDVKNNDTPIGWGALNVPPAIIASGRVAIEALPIDPVQLSGAEYRLLRLDCGLSLNEAAALHGVKRRTVQAWEKGEPPPGLEAGTRLAALRGAMDHAAQLSLTNYQDQSQGRPPEQVIVYIYSGENYPTSQAYADGLPHGAHNRLVALTADILAEQGIEVAIRYAALPR